MRKLASQLGKADPVFAVRYVEDYLVCDGHLIRRVTAQDLPVALARRPELLAAILSGTGPAYRYEHGQVSEVPPESIIRVFEQVRPRHKGQVTRVAIRDKGRKGEQEYLAILRGDGQAVVWINAEFLAAAGADVGDEVEMDGERDPVRIGPTVIAPAHFDAADAKAVAAGLMGTTPTAEIG